MLFSLVTEAKFTDDPIEEAFFGSGKVVQKENIDNLSNYMAKNGYKHHLAITYGKLTGIISEAFSNYLGYEIEIV